MLTIELIKLAGTLNLWDNDLDVLKLDILRAFHSNFEKAALNFDVVLDKLYTSQPTHGTLYIEIKEHLVFRRMNQIW